MKKALLSFLLSIGTLVPAGTWAQTVRVVTENAPPFTYMQDKKVVGTAAAVLERTMQQAGLSDYRVSMYPWARAYDMALTEPNVLIFLIARTPEREKQFQWVGEFMQMRYHLYKLRERTNITAASLDETRKYVIGVMRDDVRQQYLQRRGFSRLVVSAQPTENFNQLLNHQVDLVPLTEAATLPLCQATHFDCEKLEKVFTLDEMTTGLYMAYSKSTPPELVARTQAAFEQLRGNGTVRRLMEPGQATTVKPASSSGK